MRALRPLVGIAGVAVVALVFAALWARQPFPTGTAIAGGGNHGDRDAWRVVGTGALPTAPPP